MAIIGKVHASPQRISLEQLKVDERAYIDTDCLTITKRAIFIDHFAEVILEEHFDAEQNEKERNLLVIRRGPGLTQDDFDIFFEPDVDYELIIECSVIYQNRMKEKDLYIIFTDFKITDLP